LLLFGLLAIFGGKGRDMPDRQAKSMPVLTKSGNW
jgi:hypothetical protein